MKVNIKQNSKIIDRNRKSLFVLTQNVKKTAEKLSTTPIKFGCEIKMGSTEQKTGREVCQSPEIFSEIKKLLRMLHKFLNQAR